MRFLLDTNVLSELRKGLRAHPGVVTWFKEVPHEALFTSVLVIGEIRRGVARVKRRDVKASHALDKWLQDLTKEFSSRILTIDLPVARRWGTLGVPDPISPIDGLLAATALHHGLVLVSRNESDFRSTGCPLFNPFAANR